MNKGYNCKYGICLVSLGMEVKARHVILAWLIVGSILTLITLFANGDYADTHNWVVNHSEIPLNNY